MKHENFLPPQEASEQLAQKSIEQLINPRVLPEAGFQSYAELVSDATVQREGFLQGEYRNPTFTYSRMGESDRLNEGIQKLEAAKEAALEVEQDGVYRAAIASSLDFRRAEMEYVNLLATVADLRNTNGSPEALSEAVELARHVGGELYGAPRPEIRDAALNELWSILEAKTYGPQAQHIYHELVNGSRYEGQATPALPRAEDPSAQLPRFEDNAGLDWAGEKIIEQNADIQALIDAFWDEKVALHGDEYACAPADIAEAFQAVIDLRDPSHESGVTVRLAEGKTALSWESPEMAVLVGEKRAPITNRDELFRKVLHEFGVHGQRSINGLKTDLPVLGLGLFTEPTAEHRADYLTFEEGLATTVEEMIGDTPPQWTPAKLGHYINISLAEQGFDFRDVFETAWRYRALTSLKDGEDVTDQAIEKAKANAYNACVRIFRGTQPDLREATGLDNAPLTFNKDLAYLEGRYVAMNYLQQLYERQDNTGVEQLFAGKFDPTNPQQLELVQRATRQ